MNNIPETNRFCQCGFPNSNYRRETDKEYLERKLWNGIQAQISGGGFFSGVPVSGNFFSGSYYQWPDTPLPSTRFPFEENEKKESIFSKIKTLYHKFD